MINLTLNGKPETLPQPMCLTDAITHWKRETTHCAIAVNGQFVPKSEYATTQLQAQDHIEIVAPMQGG